MLTPTPNALGLGTYSARNRRIAVSGWSLRAQPAPNLHNSQTQRTQRFSTLGRVAATQTGFPRHPAASNLTRNRRSINASIGSDGPDRQLETSSFDVGDMLHDLASLWTRKATVEILVKSPMGLKANEDESLVRQILTAELSNVLGNCRTRTTAADQQRTSRTGPPSITVIASELDGEIRLAVQQNAKSMVMTIEKAVTI